MKTKTTISMTTARKNFFNIGNEVQKPGNYYTLTENGTPKIVIISAEEFESWQETLEALAETPNLKQIVREAQADFKKGKYSALIKPQKNVQNNRKQKSRKRTK